MVCSDFLSVTGSMVVFLSTSRIVRSPSGSMTRWMGDYFPVSNTFLIELHVKLTVEVIRLIIAASVSSDQVEA